MKQVRALALIFILFMSACKKESIRGSGRTIAELRSIANFTSVQIYGDIKAHITKKPAQSVEVKGYQNLVPVTETSVVNGTLIVKFKNEYNNVRNSNVEVFIAIPALAAANTHGNGDMDIAWFQNGDQLSVGINGSSNINISNSSYTKAILDVNGSGYIRASELVAATAETTIHGSGKIDISCNTALKARIYGNGNVKYWGNPITDVEISGNGKVNKQ